MGEEAGGEEGGWEEAAVEVGMGMARWKQHSAGGERWHRCSGRNMRLAWDYQRRAAWRAALDEQVCVCMQCVCLSE